MTNKTIYDDKLLKREIWLKAKTESGLDLTDEDINMCILTMERKGVSYFHDHIWANKRYDKHTKSSKIVWTLSADGRRAIAHQQGLAGMDPIEFEEDGEGMPHLARVRVLRRNADGGKDAYWGEARWAEYVERKRDGEIQQQWQRRPFAQLGKCAEMQALRRAFPEMDLIDEEEVGPTLDEYGPEPEPKPEPKPDPKPEPEPEPKPESEPKPEVKTEEVGLDAEKKEALILFKTWADRCNGGKSMSWKAVYEKLCGVIVAEGVEMSVEDYRALISAFLDQLGGEG